MLEIKSNFWTEDGRTLRKPDLECLSQNHRLYKTILMQLVGKISYDNNGIYLEDKTLARLKFNAFIDKTIFENADLAISPEYSCPWSCIENFILEEKLPVDGKIWILGCESIKPNNLNEIIDRHPDITWIYDQNLVKENINEDKFFDPLCIFLRTRDLSGAVVNVIIVQFKTHGFGGNDFEWERDHCIPGKSLFVIENFRPSVRLVAIICSDTLQQLNFNTIENEYFKNSPLLLIHIQLNQKPFNHNYKLYRTLLFSKERENLNKEVICLNWAKGVTYEEEGETKVFNNYGGSALYSKNSNMTLSDDRINQNHWKGLYYTGWTAVKSHIYFLNYDEFVFLIENTKPSQIDSDPSQMRRTGPKILKTFKWNTDWDEVQIIDDGFSEICSEIEDASGDISCLSANNNVADVERMIQLSVGEIDNFKKTNWSDIVNLYPFQIDDTEINNRNTFTQDPDVNSSEKRKDKLGRYHILKNKILSDPQQVPTAFANALLNFDNIGLLRSRYLVNLYSPSTGRYGTAMYIGSKTLSQAEALKVKIEGFFKDDHQGKQIIIWYNNPYLTRIFDEDRKPKINENVSISNVSYKRPR